jgi:aryl-alcohol dehydrogenase-like predicted oxidoreductase
MIEGYATPEGTQAHADRFTGIDFVPLGLSGLLVSAAGFGGYRIAAGVSDHAAALKAALIEGINLIDTSANYTDGESERLIGHVLNDLIGEGSIKREDVVVVSKAGYLQGRNYELSQNRKREDNPFPELVEYDRGLEHCLHPEFLADQLTRSLQRLDLQTLDVYLLHNPEYYLGWARKQGISPDMAAEEYYRRIKAAFAYLSTEVAKGRIRAYGISSNTLPAVSSDPEWTSLDRLIDLAAGISGQNHFQVIQLPLNLLEGGAVLVANQPAGHSVLELAAERQLGVLINRPLNAFDSRQMIRLAEIPAPPAIVADKEITDAIMAFKRSEKKFIRNHLQDLEVPAPLKQRISEQLAVADHLVHYWRNFGNYERWRQVRSGFILPRVVGVIDYLKQHTSGKEALSAWVETHLALMDSAVQAIESVYAGRAIQELEILKRRVRAADPEWARAGTLSQMAIRAVRSTRGVSSVLVGMRHPAYVADVLSELSRPVLQSERDAAWRIVAQPST